MTADVHKGGKPRQVLLGLGNHGKPTGYAATPTTVVGTQIIVGADLDAITKARDAQKTWKAQG